MLRVPFLFALLLATASPSAAQHSTARVWNEALLDAIRLDFARPPIHARNLFHVSAALYDAWAAYDGDAQPYLLGENRLGVDCTFDGIEPHAQPETALSYAAYRLLRHRFDTSPHREETMARFDATMDSLGLDRHIDSPDYSTGSPAALGNYIADCYIALGEADGANEQDDYINAAYEPVNPPLELFSNDLIDLPHPNRWQPLKFREFIDQSGNRIEEGVPPFIGAEWGHVEPFALPRKARSLHERDGVSYPVYHDPGPPPLLGTDTAEDYRWGFELVTHWSRHLTPTDSVLWDISPGAMGNLDALPETSEDYRAFYTADGTGGNGSGHAVNPHTGAPYGPQPVPRGDYTRVLAEFWADGPDSETPPGHWFTILNYVNDNPLLEKRLGGEGDVLSDLEWDVKAYFALGAAMHDAAIAAWALKGWYDYVRPISALRAMAERGQRTDPDGPRHHPDGIALVPGFLEVVTHDDPIAKRNSTHVGAFKVKTWRGPFYVGMSGSPVADVDWILLKNWWPYQRMSFVTPPFAGYVSGHSTFSRAAAETLTLLTGDPFFPGGLGEFHAPADSFLVHEKGPSVDVTLQWATYRDAADQCSLSRIWGGIHPPADDIPGRRLGARVGQDAFARAVAFYNAEATPIERVTPATPLDFTIAPNPVAVGQTIRVQLGPLSEPATVTLHDVLGRAVRSMDVGRDGRGRLATGGLAAGVYVLRYQAGTSVQTAAVHVLPR